MNGIELRDARERLGLNQKDFSAVAREALGRGFSHTSISAFENGERSVPDALANLVGVLLIQQNRGDSASLPEPDTDTGDNGGSAPAGDTPPPVPEGAQPIAPPPAAAVLSKGHYAGVCEQFFELIATAVGMIGAAVGSEALQNDGRIILQDKEALGAAWGKLAETNEVFRNLIVSTDRQGAYLAVALTTGSTVGRMWQNHQQVRETRRVVEARPAPDESHQPVGDGAVIY